MPFLHQYMQFSHEATDSSEQRVYLISPYLSEVSAKLFMITKNGGRVFVIVQSFHYSSVLSFY